MKIRSVREAASYALVCLLWVAVVLCLVLLDKNEHVWWVLLVYAGIYVGMAIVKRRSGRQ